jgi:beta-galactosidase
VAKTPEGAWGEEFGPIMPSTGDEGPSCVKVDNEYRVYTDPFESGFAYVFTSTDLKNGSEKYLI